MKYLMIILLLLLFTTYIDGLLLRENSYEKFQEKRRRAERWMYMFDECIEYYPICELDLGNVNHEDYIIEISLLKDYIKKNYNLNIFYEYKKEAFLYVFPIHRLTIHSLQSSLVDFV